MVQFEPFCSYPSSFLLLNLPVQLSGLRVQ